MVGTDVERFTVGGFQDLAWAQRGLEALTQAGFPVESLTVLIKDGPEAAAFIERTLGAPDRIELAGIGPVVVRGSLVRALQGEAGGLGKARLSGGRPRGGFQVHRGGRFARPAARRACVR